jgi:hypothetical protein
VIDRIGKAVTKVRGQARIDSFALLRAFEVIVGTSGLLIYSEEPDGIAATLVSLERNRVTPDDIHLANVEFWLV